MKRHILVVILLAGLTGIYFSDSLFGNRVWTDGPALFSSYPWKAYSPYRDIEELIEQDNTTFYIPNQIFLARALFDRGEFPLWNPLILGGTPFFASSNKHTLAVTNFVYALLDFPAAINWHVALQVFLAGLFMYLYLFRLTRSRGAASAGALIFMFSGQLIEQTFLLSIEELMWIPLALWALDVAADPPFRYWPFVLLGGTLALVFLGGLEFNTPVLYTLMGVLWLGIAFRRWRGWPGSFKLHFVAGSLLALVLCLGISGVKLFPSAENYLLSSRLLSGYPIDLDAVDATGPALTKQFAYLGLNLAFPIGPPLILRAFGGNLFYFGFLTFIVILFSLGRVQRQPYRLYLSVAIASLLISGLGRFLVTLVTLNWGELLPVSIIRPFLQHHNQALVTTIVIPVLGALSLQHLLESGDEMRRRRRYLVALVVVLALLLGMTFVRSSLGGEGPLGRLLGIVSPMMAIAVTAAAGVGLFLWSRGALARRTAWVLIIGLLAVDLMVVTRLPFRLPTREQWYPRTAAFDYLESQPGLFRITAFQDFAGPFSWFARVLAPNTAMVGGVSDIRGWTNFMWSRHAQLFSGIEGSNLAGLDNLYRNRFDMYRNTTWFKWLNLFNVKYLILSNDESDLLRPDQFRLVHSSEVRIYENRDVLPRAFIVHETEVAKGPQEAIARMSDSGFDFGRRVLLDAPLPPEHRPTGFATRAQAEIVHYGLNEVVVETDTDQPGVLVLTDSYHPGWRAEVDGHPAPLLTGDYIFRAVPVPKGVHEVRFRFLPQTFVWGLGISLGSFLFGLGLAGGSLWARRRGRTKRLHDGSESGGIG